MERTTIWDRLPERTITSPGGITVTLVSAHPESWPSDSISEHIIAAAARTSFNNFNQVSSPERDTALIRRLYKDQHTSPLEMASVTFQIRAPKFVTIQLLRHRTFKFNEESQRYHQVKEGFFRPSSNPTLFIRRQDSKNKQSSHQDAALVEAVKEKVSEIEEKLDEIFTLYQELCEIGVARECARFCLPMATWSTIIIQTDLHNLTKFLRLRLAPDAQYETRLVAQSIYQLTRPIFPVVMGSFAESLPEGWL